MNSDSTTPSGRLSETVEPAAIHGRQPKDLTVYWLIDESGSMRMDRMSTALQKALAQGFQELARPRPNYTELDLFTRILCFGQAMRWDHPTRGPMRNARISELLPYGQTNIGPALRELTREINAQSAAVNELPPIVVLFSDGLPTDDYGGALAEFDTACTALGAIRLSVSIGSLGALEFCREFLGRSSFDCLAAENPVMLPRVVENLCGSIIPAFLSRAAGVRTPVPLEPAGWTPHFFCRSLRAKRLSSQFFQAQCVRQVWDGLGGAVLADLSLSSPGDDVSARATDSVLTALLRQGEAVFKQAIGSTAEIAEVPEIADARSRLQELGIRKSRLSFVFAEGERVYVLASQGLEIVIASEAGTRVEAAGPIADSAETRLQLESHTIDAVRPCVILIGSRSLRNAFGSSEDFGAVAADMLRLSLTHDDIVKAEEALATWIQKASAAGNDAIAAVAIVFRECDLPAISVMRATLSA